jgi:hypothetical protein
MTDYGSLSQGLLQGFQTVQNFQAMQQQTADREELQKYNQWKRTSDKFNTFLGVASKLPPMKRAGYLKNVFAEFEGQMPELKGIGELMGNAAGDPAAMKTMTGIFKGVQKKINNNESPIEEMAELEATFGEYVPDRMMNHFYTQMGAKSPRDTQTPAYKNFTLGQKNPEFAAYMKKNDPKVGLTGVPALIATGEGLDPTNIGAFDPEQAKKIISEETRLLRERQTGAKPKQVGLSGQAALVAVNKGLDPTDVSTFTPEQARDVNLELEKMAIARKSGESIEVGPDGTVRIVRGTGAGKGKLGRRATGDLESKTIDASSLLFRAKEIENSFNPKFLEYGTQFKQAGLGLAEKAGMKLTPEQKQQKEEFITFKQTTFDNLNRFLNEISGAAVNEHEMKRLRHSMPIMNDSPTEFNKKLKNTMKMARHSIARYTYIKKNGFKLSDISLDEVPSLMKERGLEIANTLRANNPGFDKEKIMKEAQKLLADEFGLL